MKITLIFVLTFILSGCGMKKLAVDNADTLISYQVTRKIPLYSQQKEAFKKDLNELLNKTKPVAEELLPIIDEVDPKHPERLDSQYEKLESYYVKLAGDFSELISKYLARLDQKQQKDFFNTLEDENRDILKNEKKKTIDQAEERIKALLGSVNGKQKQIIREYEDYLASRNKARLDRRIKLHDQFRELYKQDVSVASRITSFQEAFKKYQSASLEGNKNLEIVKKFVPTISKSQREHFRNHVQDVKDMLKHYITVDY